MCCCIRIQHWWCRGLWVEVVPLVSGCCTLLGRVDRHHYPLNLSCAGSKSHTPKPRLSRRAKPREVVMLTWYHWANDLHEAGYRPRRMKFLRELHGYVFKTKASHLDGGHRLWSGMERDGLRQRHIT